jgi:hypothetical protein
VAATGGDLKVGLVGGELEHVTADQRLCRVKAEVRVRVKAEVRVRVKVEVKVEVKVKVRVWRCRCR